MFQSLTPAASCFQEVREDTIASSNSISIVAGTFGTVAGSLNGTGTELLVSSGDISLTAHKGGEIGATSMKTSAGSGKTVTVSTTLGTGNVNVDNRSGLNVVLAAAGGTIGNALIFTNSQGGLVTLGSDILSSNGGILNISATGASGSVLNTNNKTLTTTSNVTVNANNGDVGKFTNPILTNAGSLTAKSTAGGDVYVSNSSALLTIVVKWC